MRTHPQIRLPDVVKETFFLDRRFERGWEWYWKEFFPRAAVTEEVYGEIAPTAFDATEAPSRLAGHNPRARIIICVRDPVERSVSLFHHYHAISRVGQGFTAALEAQPSIVRASLYRAHIVRWSEVFGAENVLLVPHSAVEAAALDTLNAVYDFLGVPQITLLPDSVRTRYGEAAVPRNRWIAMLADRTAWVLRAVGLHRVVNLAKSLGLKNWLLDGGDRQPPALTQEELGRLRERLAEERNFAEKLAHQGVVTAAECTALWQSEPASLAPSGSV